MAHTMKRRPVSLTGVLAGVSLGLVVGATVLGIAISGGSATHAAASTASFLLAGALFLLPVVTAIGLPALFILKRRDASAGTILGTLWALALLVALTTTIILGVITRSPLNSALAVFPATIWCTATGTVGGAVLSARRAASLAIIATVTGLTIVSAAVLISTWHA